jgi:hypothetical protein
MSYQDSPSDRVVLEDSGQQEPVQTDFTYLKVIGWEWFYLSIGCPMLFIYRNTGLCVFWICS